MRTYHVLHILHLLPHDLLLLRCHVIISGHARVHRSWHHGRHIRKRHHAHAWDIRKQLLLHGVCMILIARVRCHGATQVRLISSEEFVKVGSRFRATRDSCKSPSVEFSRKGRKLGSFEMLRQNLCDDSYTWDAGEKSREEQREVLICGMVLTSRKSLLFMNLESSAVG